MGNYDAPEIKKMEEKVSSYMRNNLSFTIIKIEDTDDKIKLESKLISTISWYKKYDILSSDWLGNFSPKLKIRESGLWLVQELHKEPFSDSWLEDFLNKYFSK